MGHQLSPSTAVDMISGEAPPVSYRCRQEAPSRHSGRLGRGAGFGVWCGPDLPAEPTCTPLKRARYRSGLAVAAPDRRHTPQLSDRITVTGRDVLAERAPTRRSARQCGGGAGCAGPRPNGHSARHEALPAPNEACSIGCSRLAGSPERFGEMDGGRRRGGCDGAVERVGKSISGSACTRCLAASPAITPSSRPGRTGRRGHRVGRAAHLARHRPGCPCLRTGGRSTPGRPWLWPAAARFPLGIADDYPAGMTGCPACGA